MGIQALEHSCDGCPLNRLRATSDKTCKQIYGRCRSAVPVLRTVPLAQHRHVGTRRNCYASQLLAPNVYELADII